MRKISKDAANAFMNDLNFKSSNTRVTFNGSVTHLYLHGNLIAERNIPDNRLHIRNAGWFSVTTKERLNALPGVSICQKKGAWYLNGKEWNGEWIEIK